MEENILKLHVWVHSNYKTGKPDSVDVMDVDGEMNMHWFTEAMEDGNGAELAEQFHKHLKRLDDSAWFLVSQETEDATGVKECYVEVLGLVDN